MTWKSPERSFS